MRTYTARVKVGPWHIDAGDHVNWLAQLKIAEELHFALRDEIGLGLERLMSEQALFLVMGKIHEVTYHRQVRLNDLLEVRIKMWPSRPTCFDFLAEFSVDSRPASTMRWTMPLVSIRNGRICRIPTWMLQAVEGDLPRRAGAAAAS